MILKTIICDDEQSVCKELDENLKRYSYEMGIEVNTKICNDGIQLIGLLNEFDCDLILLDIEMPDMDGMEAARIIRKSNDNVTIIFITNLVKYALEGYEVQAYRFLEKPVCYEQFVNVIDGAVKRIADDEKKYIIVKNEKGLTRIFTSDILFFETFHGHVLVHGKKDSVECFQTMSALEKMLECQGFFRCHSAYLINLSKVSKLMSKDVQLIDNTEIPVSKHRRKHMVESLTDYWGGLLL